jgi:hypothetical protein
MHVVVEGDFEDDRRDQLVICPAVDGAKGAPSVFDSSDKDAAAPAPIRSMTLETSAGRRRNLAPLPPSERLTRAKRLSKAKWVSDGSLITRLTRSEWLKRADSRPSPGPARAIKLRRKQSLDNGFTDVRPLA